MNILFRDRRFTIVRSDRPAARIYHLPRIAAAGPGRRPALTLVWSIDRATGQPVSRWLAAGDPAADVDRRRRRGGILRLSAALRPRLRKAA